MNNEVELLNEVGLFLNSVNPNLKKLVPNKLLDDIYYYATIDESPIIDLDTFDFSEEARDVIVYIAYNYFFNEKQRKEADNFFENSKEGQKGYFSYIKAKIYSS